ncbi:MAG: PBP1A family penicillin-binding protein, partial [Pseudomonadota bacterium]
MKVLKTLFWLTLVGFGVAVVSVIGIYFYLKPDLPSVEVLQDVQLQTPMRIYTQDGQLISQYGEKRRVPLTYDEVPDELVQAIVATEDSRFYQHYGVDPIGVVRAAINLIVTGEKGQGASTLTMQVARSFFLDRRKMFSRKIKEIFIAMHMEEVLTKEQILMLYLNKMELGHRAFGVGAAAQVYYGKTLSDLNLAQLATIAGLYQAPSRLNPISNPDASVKRRRIVLLRMLDEGYITKEQFDLASNAPVTAKKHGADIDLDAPYLAKLVYTEMVERYGKDIAETSGFNVYTTAHSMYQASAQKALSQNLYDYDERHGYRGAIGQLWGTIVDEEQTALDGDVETIVREETASETVDGATIETAAEQGSLTPDSHEEIDLALAEIPELGSLIAAVVLEVSENNIFVRTLYHERLEITWEGLDWARRYIDDYKQGPEPETAADAAAEGELIYIRQREKDDVWQLSQLPIASSAFVALNPLNGAVEAVVGGFSFYQSQFNRATQAKRQVGSNIKPFIYAAALDNGYTLASIINDAPINQWDANSGIAWRPQNSPAIYDGPIRMRTALGKSKNVVSVRLLRGVGLSQSREYLTKFGFLRDEVPPDETMSLGSGAHTPMEVATAMAIIANGGFAIEPHVIQRVENLEGEVLYEAEPTYACDPCELDTADEQEEAVEIDIEALLAAQFNQLENDETAEKEKESAPRVISEETAFLMREMLRTAARTNGRWNTDTYWQGTGWRARHLLQRTDIGGKTGTTNDSRDTWFTGFAPGLVATSWVGFDDNNQKLGRATRNQNIINRNPEKFNWIGNGLIGAEDGAKAAQPAWIYFMQNVLDGVP